MKKILFSLFTMVTITLTAQNNNPVFPGWYADPEGIIFNDPTTEDERAEEAAACMLRYNFSFPMLLEKMNNAAEEAYQSWPDRLYLIDAKGTIAYQGGMGPLYFDVDELEGSIHALLNS